MPHAIDFRLHLGADYNEFTTGGATTSRHRSIGVQAGLLLTALPYHVFSFDVFDNYVRTVQPPYNGVPYNYDRDTNEAGVRLAVHLGERLGAVKPGLLAGWIYVVIVSIRELSSSILLYSPGTEVLSIMIWELWQNGQYVELSALGVMLIFLLFCLVMLAQLVGKRFGISEA